MLNRIRVALRSAFGRDPQTSPGAYLTIHEAWPYLMAGRAIRRRAWREGCRLRRENGAPFVRIENSDTLWAKRWTPYVTDVLAYDWQVL